ncbi:MAG: N-acetylmuramoyl-L-alanine amidase [Treponema sp.]|nr:N-acetylmuramoyl-L-alanine amidase [Treponema sp.]
MYRQRPVKRKGKAPSVCVGVFLLLVFALPAGAQAARSGKIYTLDEAQKELGPLTWDPFFQSGVFVKGEHRLNFYTGAAGEQGMALLDSRELVTLYLPYLENGRLLFPASFVEPVRAAFSRILEEDRTRFRIAAVIIDPGHGGKDSGAVGTHTVNGKTFRSVEKEITLAVSKNLSTLLGAAFPDKRILLTRTGDSYPTLEERVGIANAVPLRENEAIIYVSIHANASLNKAARGYEVWYLPAETRRTLIDREKYADAEEVIPILNDMLEEEFTSESTRIGQFILNRFREALGSRIPARGLKAENWYVIRNARMPAVLVELGFVTNLQDAQFMASEEGLKSYAASLYKGITDFIEEFEKSGGYVAP